MYTKFENMVKKWTSVKGDLEQNEVWFQTKLLGGSRIVFFDEFFCIFAKVESKTSRYFAKCKSLAFLELHIFCIYAKDMHL